MNLDVLLLDIIHIMMIPWFWYAWKFLKDLSKMQIYKPCLQTDSVVWQEACDCVLVSVLPRWPSCRWFRPFEKQTIISSQFKLHFYSILSSLHIPLARYLIVKTFILNFLTLDQLLQRGAFRILRAQRTRGSMQRRAYGLEWVHYCQTSVRPS